MNLNLKIHPLNSLENLVNQKCLIPATKFPEGLQPGSWCKCYRGSGADESYSICQVFSRSNIPLNCCFMDSTVGAGSDTAGEAHEILTRLEKLAMETLQINDQVVEVEQSFEVTLTFTVTEQLFTHRINKITLDFLIQAAQHFLQSLHLVLGCQVHLDDLEHIGIARISIDNATGKNESTAFCLDDKTLLHVGDVQLLGTRSRQNFYPHSFERVQRDLADLLQVALMQKNCKWEIRPSLNALLVGAAGSGKSALAQWFINKYHFNCFKITAADVLGQFPGETEASLRKKFESAKTFVKQLHPKFPTVLLIEELHLLCPLNKISSDAANALRTSSQLLSLVDDLHVARLDIICLATTSSPETLYELARRPGRFEREISLTKPTEEQRILLFHALFEECFYASEYRKELTDELLQMLANQTQGFVVADLELLLRNVGQRLLRRNTNTTFATILKKALKQSKPTSMRGTDVKVYKTKQRFDSIGGMQQLKRTLEVSILAGLKQQAAFRRFGLNLPKGVLLYGPPGCAKTSIAKCLATEANMTFIATSGADVYSPYVGCAEKFIAKIFDTARKNAPCLIFLDEIDSLVGRRSSDSKGEIQIRILSTLLTEMDGIISSSSPQTENSTNFSNHILVVAATNRPDMLDDALMRPGRLDKLIHVPAPDLEARVGILNLYAQRMPFADDVDLSSIAALSVNYSGADICNLCNEAALHALNCDFNAAKVNMRDFQHVLSEQKSSLTHEQIQWYLNFEKKFAS